MRLIATVLLLLALTACAGVNPLVVDRKAVEIEQYHPTLPPPIRPVSINVKILTYETTTALNERVDTGRELPYVFMGLHQGEYLTLGQWHLDNHRYIKQLLGIIEYYRGGEDDGR